MARIGSGIGGNSSLSRRTVLKGTAATAAVGAIGLHVGDKINKAIERIASGQQDGRAAMALAQEEAINDLKKAGIRI
jgi:hypothetical protein